MFNFFKEDIIYPQDILKKLPFIAKKIPGVAKGLWSAFSTDPTQPTGLGLTFEQAVERNPQGTALLYENMRLSYTELNQWANQIAHYFIQQGFQKGDCVALLMENRPEFIACVLGLAKIGAVSALLNTSQRAEVLQHSIQLVTPKAIIIGEELIENYLASPLEDSSYTLYFFDDPHIHYPTKSLPHGFISLSKAIQQQPSHNPASTYKIYRKDPCFYIYTSGTTGLPKAGIFSHDRWMKTYGGYGLATLQLSPKDVLYCTLPLYHGTGIAVCFGAVIAGAAGFAIRRKFSASYFWSDVRRYHATAIGYVGELCRYLMNQAETPQDKEHPVRKMIGNGLRPILWKAFKQRFGIEEVYELYAASDGNIGFTNILNFDNTVGLSPVSFAIVEYDVENEQAVLTNRGFMKKVKLGDSGLLLGEISQRTPLDGYVKDKKSSDAVIFHNVFKKGDAWFNTGDLMRRMGFHHAQFVDRLGDTFRWKGENVSTTEVENCLNQFDGINESIVYGVEIPHTNGRAGMAVIHFRIPLAQVNFSELYNYLEKKLPTYAVPLFLRIQQELETTGTFKYKKSHLKQEGYDLKKVKEPLYVLLPNESCYQPLTVSLQKKIDGGSFRF